MEANVKSVDISPSSLSPHVESETLFDTKNKILLFLTIGLFFFVIFYLLYSLDVVFFGNKKSDSFVEKVSAVSNNIATTSSLEVVSSNTTMAPSFRVIHVVDDNGKKLLLTKEDTVVVDAIVSLLKKDSRTPSYVSFDGLYTLGDIIVASSFALVTVGIPKQIGSENNFVIDLNKKEITDIFTGHSQYFVNTDTFFTGDDAVGFLYYTYGASSSVKIENSKLYNNESYTEWRNISGEYVFGILSTTKKSITFGVYDTTKEILKEKVPTIHYLKIKEKTFLIP